jgi:hypothetical protein
MGLTYLGRFIKKKYLTLRQSRLPQS